MLLKLYRIFKLLPRKVAAIQTRIILTFVYIVFVPIFALILRISREKRHTRTGWVPWTISEIQDIKKQF